MQTAKEIRTANLRSLVAEFCSIQRVSVPDGTLLFVDPEQTPRCGSCVIVSRDGRASPTLKRVVLVGGKACLEAMNSRRPSAYSRIRKNDRLLGVVVFARFDFA